MRYERVLFTNKRLSCNSPPPHITGDVCKYSTAPRLCRAFSLLLIHTSVSPVFCISSFSSLSYPPSPPPSSEDTLGVDDGDGDQKRADILYLISYPIIHLSFFLSPSLGLTPVFISVLLWTLINKGIFWYPPTRSQLFGVCRVRDQTGH